MGKKYELGLVIGRFQPLHLGHEKLIRQAIEECEKVAVYVGSSQANGTPANPFDYKTREAMIKMVFGDSVSIRPLPDIWKGDSPSWGRYVLDTVKKDFGMFPGAVFLSEDGERSHWFDGIEERPFERYVSRQLDCDGGRLSGTCVRNHILRFGASGMSNELDDRFVGSPQIRSLLENRIKAANGRRALVVIDMQNDFVTGSLANPAAKEICPRIAALVKNGCYTNVIYTKDDHSPDYLMTSEGLNLPIKHCMYATSGFDIVPEIDRNLADVFATGESKSSFGDISLPDLNEFDAVGAIDIVGTCTDICVISNALILKAAFPEKEIRVLKGACAATTPEMQEAALKVMANCQIEIA